MRHERGQAILLFVGIFSVILVIAAIVVDFGLWWAERRSAQRVADLAAAAAAMDLPFDDTNAEASAIAWAAENGQTSGVEVTLLCNNNIPDSELCTNTNPPGAGPSACTAGSGCDTVRVVVDSPAPMLFSALPFFDIGPVEVEAGAVAGVTFGEGPAGAPGPDEMVLLLNADVWMGEGCGSNPTGCPITKAKEAALNLVQLLLPPDATNLVGYAPYHNCFGPRHPINPPVGCVADVDPGNLVLPPVSSGQFGLLEDAILGTIDYTSPANICVALSKAGQMFSSTAGRRVLVLLSDGDNLDTAMVDEHAPPPPECSPTTSLQFGTTPDCGQSRPAESQLDYLTWQRAEALKAQGIEIFVIGTRMCPSNGVDDGQVQSPSYCNAIADIDFNNLPHDNQADQRLLKCIASSPDHYRRVAVSDLPDVFNDIGVELSSRSLLQ